MPGRKTPLVTDEIYHVYNRGINRQPTFTTKKEYQRAMLALKFYKVANPPVRLSKFLESDKERQAEILKMMDQGEKLVEILCFCLMPNHFHFLLKQKKEGGISKFLGNFQNSYTRYFNTLNERDGSLFLDQFKAKRIETDEQLIHVSRYIHLNPYTGFAVKSFKELEKYPWSSFPSYLTGDNSFIEPDLVLGTFKGVGDYREFVLDQANYQRELKFIEHLLLE
ncbi:MAG: transposase [Candidatus Daviesbacteria bacterium]|nr:MAG: transposase [Candidatus Daviesbacteria bacterium]